MKMNSEYHPILDLTLNDYGVLYRVKESFIKIEVLKSVVERDNPVLIFTRLIEINYFWRRIIITKVGVYLLQPAYHGRI